MLMTGGAISGNCAIGSTRPATAPTTVMTTEMTPARIGRSTKNANMRLPAPAAPVSVVEEPAAVQRFPFW